MILRQLTYILCVLYAISAQTIQTPSGDLFPPFGPDDSKTVVIKPSTRLRPSGTLSPNQHRFATGPRKSVTAITPPVSKPLASQPPPPFQQTRSKPLKPVLQPTVIRQPIQPVRQPKLSKQPISTLRQQVVPIRASISSPTVFSQPIVQRGQNSYSGPEHTAQILHQQQDIGADRGSYSYSFETDNGISVQANANSRPLAPDVDALEVSGSYKYTSPEGQTVVMTYVANENGYQPQSDLLPTPPPIPRDILKALKYIQERAPKSDSFNTNRF